MAVHAIDLAACIAKGRTSIRRADGEAVITTGHSIADIAFNLSGESYNRI